MIDDLYALAWGPEPDEVVYYAHPRKAARALTRLWAAGQAGHVKRWALQPDGVHRLCEVWHMHGFDAWLRAQALQQVQLCDARLARAADACIHVERFVLHPPKPPAAGSAPIAIPFPGTLTPRAASVPAAPAALALGTWRPPPATQFPLSCREGGSGGAPA